MELRSGKILPSPTDNRTPSRRRRILSRSTGNSESHEDTKGHEVPEELVERIFALFPFPQILKVRTLSKSWHARFSPTSSQDDEEKKSLAVTFQNLVCESSDRWKTLCPVFLFKKFIVSFDQETHNWRKISALSVLGRRELRKLKKCLPLRQRMFFWNMAGALLFITTSVPEIMFVVNVFTGSWKELPAAPSLDQRFRVRKRLVSYNEMYKVIRLYEVLDCFCASVYDSKQGAWRTVIHEFRDDYEVGWWDVYLNGVIYVTIFFQNVIWGFLAFDVKDETFNLLQMPPSPVRSYDLPSTVQPVACNGSLYILVVNYGTGVNLAKADLVSRKWSKVLRSPPTLEYGILWGRASTDGETIYFEGERLYQRRGPGVPLDRKILAYYVREDYWSHFAMNQSLQQSLRLCKNLRFDIAFHPGMDPFLEV